MQQLKSRGYQLASIWPSCRRDEESLEHILIHCPSIWGLWADLFSVLGICWTCPFLVKDLICSGGQIPGRKNGRRLWRAAPLTIFWAVWKERNIIILDNIPLLSK